MHVKIKNLTNRPVLLRCNSGETLHIPPNTTLEKIPDIEIKNNPEVRKLKDRHVIAVPDEEKDPPPASSEKEEEKPKKGKK